MGMEKEFVIGAEVNKDDVYRIYVELFENMSEKELFEFYEKNYKLYEFKNDYKLSKTLDKKFNKDFFETEIELEKKIYVDLPKISEIITIFDKDNKEDIKKLADEFNIMYTKDHNKIRDKLIKLIETNNYVHTVYRKIHTTNKEKYKYSYKCYQFQQKYRKLRKKYLGSEKYYLIEKESENEEESDNEEESENEEESDNEEDEHKNDNEVLQFLYDELGINDDISNRIFNSLLNYHGINGALVYHPDDYNQKRLLITYTGEINANNIGFQKFCKYIGGVNIVEYWC